MNQLNQEYTAPNLYVRLFSLLLGLIGSILLSGGVYLILLGGSWYYALAGAGSGISALWLWQGRIKGVWIFLAGCLLTVIWSLFEVGLDFWPLVPRLVAPIFLCSLVLFIAPSLDYKQHVKSKIPFMMSGGALMLVFVLFIVGMFRPHDIVSNNLVLSKGNISKTTLDAGNDWYAYGRTGYGNRYVPSDQITPENIGKLEVAWTARTGFIADQAKSLDDQNVPLYVDGTLYHCAPAGQVSALDGTTGEIKWQFDPKAESTDWKRCRSLAYFDPGPGDSCGPRIIETTVDARLIAIRTEDGRPCETFGDKGTVNIWAGMGESDPEYLTNSSGPVVVNGKIILGGRVADNVTNAAPSGVIRAYDARTGEMVWVWDLGQPDLSIPLAEDQSYTLGTPNAWSLLSFDADLGMVYVPLGNAAPDIFGGQRRKFDDEYSSSVVALDVNTGKEIWKFQTVRHDLWDYDIPAQPVLTDIPDGKGGIIPGLVQTTKRAQIFVLDRRTGKPIKAVVDRPAPKSDGTIKGEYYAATQPYSPQMAAPGTEPLQEKTMWGATPLDQMICRILFRQYRYDGEFTTPSIHDSIVWPGPMGGMNFGSTAIDEVNNVMVFAEMRLAMVHRLVPREEVSSDMKYSGESGPYAPMLGTPYAMTRDLFKSPLGVPCNRPPWGTVSVVDLASGKLLWQQPAGTAEDLAFGQFQPGIPFYVGMPPMGGPIITGGGIAWFAGTQDFYLRAFDLKSGKSLWKGRLPSGTQTTPMSYIGKDGRQYIVISAGGARYNMTHMGDYIVAFALPKGM